MSKADKEKVRELVRDGSLPPDDNMLANRPLNYIEFQLILNFIDVNIRLKMASIDILRVNFNNILTRFEMKPVANSIYFLMNTQSINVDGKSCLMSSINSL